MTNVTLSVEDSVYNKMKLYSEIKWSEFIRKCIQQRIKELQSINSGIFADNELLAENWLSEEDNKAWKNL